MRRLSVNRGIQIAAAALIVAALVKELSKPPRQRTWHGRILFIPYEFRRPTWERIKETYWNPYDKHLLTPMVFGLGWTINLYALLENLGLIRQSDASEESFLLPNRSLKAVLRPAQKPTG